MPEIYEVYPGSLNDPDTGPNRPAARGNWVWVRTGPHPQGEWHAMDWSAKGFGAWYAQNRKDFPVFQDQAHGSPGDFGNYVCHACNYFGDGYPEPGHMTVCDGICKRKRCYDHSPIILDKVDADDFAGTMEIPNRDGPTTYWRQISKEEYDSLQPTPEQLQEALDELDDETP